MEEHNHWIKIKTKGEKNINIIEKDCYKKKNNKKK